MQSIEPYVARLFVYPIKSLDLSECDRVEILASGAIKGDRTWALLDLDNNFVNGKRNHKIHSLRSEFDSKTNNLSLQIEGTEKIARFNLLQQKTELCNWLGQYFGFPITIAQNTTMGFPDDTVSPGATIVSTATLEEIASWYPKLNTNDIRRRFRTNIEIAGVPAFWEDCLFANADTAVKFKVGEVEFMGINPCQRCVVVTRNPQTGKPYPQFQKIFIDRRQKTLPEWSTRSRFNHFFRLAVNTRLSSIQGGKTIAVGDKISLCNSVDL